MDLSRSLRTAKFNHSSNYLLNTIIVHRSPSKGFHNHLCHSNVFLKIKPIKPGRGTGNSAAAAAVPWKSIPPNVERTNVLLRTTSDSQRYNITIFMHPIWKKKIIPVLSILRYLSIFQGSSSHYRVTRSSRSLQCHFGELVKLGSRILQAEGTRKVEDIMYDLYSVVISTFLLWVL